jgi:uncharacterized membrane protein YczE
MDILDTTSKEENIKIFSFKKLATAFLIGFGIDFTRRLFEPVQGPFAILISPIFSIYYTAKFFLLAVLPGFLFYIPQLKEIWFKNKSSFIILLFIGIVLFGYGTVTANHIYFDLHKSGEEADIYC